MSQRLFLFRGVAAAFVSAMLVTPVLAQTEVDPTGLPSDPAGWSYARWRDEPDRFPGTLELIAGKFAVHTDVYHRAAVGRLIERGREATDDAGRARLFRAALVASELAEAGFANEAAAADSMGEAGAAAIAFRDGLRAWGRGEVDAARGYFVAGVPVALWDEFDRHAAMAAIASYGAEAGHLPARRPGAAGFVAWTAETIGDRDRPQTDRLLFGLAEAIVAFGQDSSLRPLLFECLGDVLLVKRREGGEPDGLPERAYLRAAVLSRTEASAEGYRRLAAAAVATTAPGDVSPDSPAVAVAVDETGDQLALEAAESERWADELEEKERDWAAAGLDPVAEYHTRYASQIIRVPRSRLRHRYTNDGIPFPLIAGTLGLTVVTLAGLFWVVRRKAAATTD